MPSFSAELAIASLELQAGRTGAAEQIVRHVLARDPGQVAAMQLLGLIALQAGRGAEAVEHLAQAATLAPAAAEIHNNLGEAYRQVRQHAAAIASFQQALQTRPDLVPAWNNLGAVLYDVGRRAEAIACYRRAVELKPDFAKALNNLGAALAGQGHLVEAAECCRRALQVQPQFAEAHNNLGNVLADLERIDEAGACYQRALECRPDYALAHSNWLCALQYQPGITSAQLAAAHAEYQRRQAAPLRSTWQPHANDRDPQRPLRLGFVSGDFAEHPVGYFLVGVLEHLDRAACATVCYNGRVQPDAMTHRLRAAAGTWRDVYDQSDEQLAAQIRADRIDVLFDLAGHTADNRLLVFARKPAPLQITWMGYAGTTGLEAMDLILADRHQIPPGSEAAYVEQVLRMPRGYVCYTPPTEAPPVGPLPALGTGRVTFACFNNPGKINRGVLARWAEILGRVPHSVLRLQYRMFDDPGIAARCRAALAAAGVDATRLELRGFVPRAELLAEYNRVDIALDPFPYAGGVTTCEALWMGVPVITCPGETFAGRHALSHLMHAGVTETIAASAAEYVDRAVALAQDLPRLAALRESLRPRLAASPLCDGRRFADDLLAALRAVWHTWTRQDPPRITLQRS